MKILRLFIKNFRAIESLDITLNPSLNIFTGDNGVGKTSILEAVHMLGMGKSFRSHKIADLIQHHKTELIVSGKLKSTENIKTQLGIMRSRQQTNIKVNSKLVRKTSILARHLPLQIIHPESYLLIAGGPLHRRQYLDWGLFHVEPNYHQLWQRYQRALKQRNALLRNKNNNAVDIFDHELSSAAAAINDKRQAYLSNLLPIIADFAAKLLPACEIKLVYRPGWDLEMSLKAVLQQNYHNDCHKGYTAKGPHRADIDIKVNAYNASSEISRGQQKMLVLILRLAQLQLYKQLSNKNCLLMIDDINSEIDKRHQQLLLNILQQLEMQIIVNCIDKNDIDFSAWHNKTVFHVKPTQQIELINQ